MADVIITLQQNAKIRVDRMGIDNGISKQIDFGIAARPINVDGTYGAPVYKETHPVPVDAALISLTPPADTVVELAPGLTIPIGGVPMAMAYALLQWYGERVCEERRPVIERAIQGLPPIAPEAPPVVEAEPDPNAPQDP